MKILHVNGSDIGSTGRIVQGICAEAHCRGWKSVFLFPRRNRTANPLMAEHPVSLPLEQGIYRRIYYVSGLHYGFAPISTARILWRIRKEKPDLVHLHSINCATVNIYRLLLYLKRRNIATVVTNHAEFFYTGNCPHAYDCEKWKTGCGNCPNLFAASDSKLFDRTHRAWQKMQKSFCGHKKVCVVSVSPWVYERSLQSPILAGLPQRIILNGINTNVFRYLDMCSARENLGLPQSERIVVHVTANFSNLPTDAKGGWYLLDLAKQLHGTGIRFLVIGQHGHIENLPGNVTLLGKIQDAQVLAQYYAAADLCIAVSKRETFGMTVAEALCCGTPVVGFMSGGSESIALPEYTQFVPFGDGNALKKAVCDWLPFKHESNPEKLAGIAAQVYSEQNMARQYCELYEQITGEG